MLSHYLYYAMAVKHTQKQQNQNHACSHFSADCCVCVCVRFFCCCFLYLSVDFCKHPGSRDLVDENKLQ